MFMVLIEAQRNICTSSLRDVVKEENKTTHQNQLSFVLPSASNYLNVLRPRILSMIVVWHSLSRLAFKEMVKILPKSPSPAQPNWLVLVRLH